MTLRALARAVAIGQSSLGNIESGKVRQPMPKTLSALARELGLDFANLMTLAAHPFPGDDRVEPWNGPFSDVTDEEADELRKYLTYLRWSQRSAPRG